MNISIIIPVYNVESYLEQCLESVVHQSVQFDEVILINDGSTDNSLFICEKYVSIYPYFKLINQKNKGLSMARNVGIEFATSEFVMFLDSDDYLNIDTVKILKSFLQNLYLDAIFFDADIYCEEDNNLEYKNLYDRSNANLDGVQMSGWDYFEMCYPRNYVVQVCMAIYKKNVITDNKIKFPEGLYYEDNYFSFVFLQCADHVIHISEKLYQRRYRYNSIIRSEYSEKKFVDFLKITSLIWNKVCFLNSNIIISRKELLFEFVSNYYEMNLSNYQLCKMNDIVLNDNVHRKFLEISKQYVNLVDKLNLNVNTIKFGLLNKLLRDYCNVCKIIKNDIDIRRRISEIVSLQKIFYYKLLNELPLNKSKCKVGIYGMGKHTEGFIAVYEKIFGKIVCDLVFLDSYKKDGKYKGKKIINYREADTSFEMIIISSFLYESVMIDNLKRICSDISIHSFYNNLYEDVFSECQYFLEYY